MPAPVEQARGTASARAFVADLTAQVPLVRRWRAVGRVVELVGLTVVAEGPPAGVGELCVIEVGAEGVELPAQVIGFRRGLTLLLPLARMSGVEPGCLVRATGRPLQVRVGPGVLGRVLDAFGQPLDGKGAIGQTVACEVEKPAPRPLQRQRVLQPMHFGIRALDALLTCGKGQRLGIFSGAGVGKSSLLGMMARSATRGASLQLADSEARKLKTCPTRAGAARTTADVTVVALVGERGREVGDFLDAHLKTGLERAVVVVATSDEPALVRITAGLTATAIAEYFRDQGLDVLLIVDSLTRLARAQREVGLAAGEAPTTRGFPPSVHEFLPRLLERAGPGETGAADRVGTITGVYSVLVEGDDRQEPVADAVSAILDGHIVLSRELAEQGQYPAVEVNASVSRLMQQVVDEEQWRAAVRFKSLLAARKAVEDLVAVGAYRPGSRPLADLAIQQAERLTAFLCQPEDEIAPPAQSRQALLELCGQTRDS